MLFVRGAPASTPPDFQATRPGLHFSPKFVKILPESHNSEERKLDTRQESNFRIVGCEREREYLIHARNAAYTQIWQAAPTRCLPMITRCPSSLPPSLTHSLTRRLFQAQAVQTKKPAKGAAIRRNSPGEVGRHSDSRPAAASKESSSD